MGVAGDEKIDGLSDASWPEIFFPLSQVPAATLRYVWRPNGSGESALNAFRDLVGELDPNLPVFRVGRLEDIVASSVSRQRFLTTLVGLFATLALALAAIGIYGVVAYGVTERTYEIGVRMALGARANDVVGMITRESFLYGTVGVGLGISAALALGTLVAGLLFEVSAHDPLTFLVVITVTSGITFVASYLPARRATRVHPMTVLRAERSVRSLTGTAGSAASRQECARSVRVAVSGGAL